MTAQKNTDTSMGAAVGGNLLNKLNLPGLGGAGGGPGGVMASMQGLGKAGGGGYQPKMFGAKAPGDSTDPGQVSDRSFTSRFGSANNVSASIDVVPSTHKFLGTNIQERASNVMSSM